MQTETQRDDAGGGSAGIPSMDFLFPLKGRATVGKETMAFEFDTSAVKDFDPQAGQSADFTLIDPPETDPKGNTRTFSIASSPHHKDFFLIATRMRSTAFKRSLQKIPLGTKVRVSRPTGSFTLPDDMKKPVIFIAGGIGITPMRSMIEWAVEKKLPYQMTLFYSNRAPADAAFSSDFEEWQKQAESFKFVPTITQPGDASWPYERGRIDAAMIKKYIPQMDLPIFFVAGPPGMVLAMNQALIQSGADEENIRTDEFYGY
jgi:ferredoxin-NADP reductase